MKGPEMLEKPINPGKRMKSRKPEKPKNPIRLRKSIKLAKPTRRIKSVDLGKPEKPIKIETPICDFVRSYRESRMLRLHMPGHKGASFLAGKRPRFEDNPNSEVEALDITEIQGGDSLYESEGIIRESEENASRLFGCETLYSTEGSSLCIRAMLYLAVLSAREKGRNGNGGNCPLIAAGRNVHKTFVSAAALLDFDILWLYPQNQDSYLSCMLSGEELDRILSGAERMPDAVYLTSPDYLGNILDIKAISQVCRRYGILLLVDNAHGAYLKFLPKSIHPMDLGADLCCDSAHKTLPVLTGGAYLHLSKALPISFSRQGKQAMGLFGSTSPSYLILQSLDRANRYLAEGYGETLAIFLSQMERLKGRLSDHGYSLLGEEPLKLTVNTKSYGYEGGEFAELLFQKKIVCEFSDPDFVVMMMTPETGISGLKQLEAVMCSIPRRDEIEKKAPRFHLPFRAMTVREAALSPRESVPLSESLNRVLASESMGCPPAVPILVCGEIIHDSAISCFEYYGIKTCWVVKNTEGSFLTGCKGDSP